MKANELMIGDWVKTNDLYKAIKDVKVYAMSQYSVEDETTNQWILCQHIEPIPLTAEILKKNGWKYEDYANEYSIESEEYFVCEDFDIYINNDGKFQITSMDTININLDYVHQLQHALKLCGIDKEIVL